MKHILFVLITVVGCDAAYRDREVTDTPDPDPITCGTLTCDQVPAATCVDDTTLREYGTACSDGACDYPAVDVECGVAGCCGDHCCALSTSNAEAVGTLAPTGLTVSPPSGTFDTDSDCTASASLGSCAVATRAGLPDACVCRMDQLTIGALEVKGSRVLVLLAYESVRIDEVLDLSGDRAIAGPGATAPYARSTSTSSGGVGGTFATPGGAASGNTTTLAATYGDEALIPLHGGTSGQTSGNAGGGGGGAIQITAGARIEVVGSIHAGGGGGAYGHSSYGIAGAGGGGSGGAILLEAPTVIVSGSLAANGGGGGGGGGSSGPGADGEDAGVGRPSGGPGTGGDGCSLYGYVYGGQGGSGATDELVAGSGQAGDYEGRCRDAAFVGGGGGGGGLGRIRINTISGCQCSGTISPGASFGVLGAS